MAISIPDRFYDYVLYYECGDNERLNESLWTNIKSTSPGQLLTGVKWNAAGNNVGDGAGITRFGVTPVAIKAYRQWSKNKSYVLNSASSWKLMVNYFWKESCADQSANVACAIIMCQGKWGGWGKTSIKNACDALRKNANDKDKASNIKGSGYKTMAQLTHCFTNPMDAFLILRSYRISYLRSCGNAKTFAGGWMRREFFAMQADGLYCEPGSKLFTKYGFTPIPQMEKVAEQLKKNKDSRYVKLMSWDGTPSSNISLEGVDDGSNDQYGGGGDSSSGGDSGFSVGHGSTVDGGILEMSKANTKHKTNGLILGTTILQK